MKKKYIAPQFTSFELLSEHSMMLSASNIEGDGIQLSDRRDESWEDSQENWGSFPWED